MTIAFVQKGANSQVGGAGAPGNTPTISGVTAGNWLVALGWSASSLSANYTPTTPSGWTVAAQGISVLNGGVSINSAIYFKQSVAGGSESCAFNWVASDIYSECCIFEVSAPGGLVLGPVLRSSANGVSSLTVGPTSATSAQTLVAAVANMLDGSYNGTNISVASSGYTGLYNDPSGAVYIPGDSAYKIVSAGTQQATWTWTTNSQALGSLATFTEGSSGTNLTPGAAALTIAGQAPTVARTANQSVAPGVGALTLSGFAPTVARTANQSVVPGVGALTLAGYAPTVNQSAGLNLTPGVAALALTGYAPTVARTANQSLTPGVGSLALTGYAPTISQPQGVSPGVGALSLTGFAPAVAQSANQSVSPGTGALSLTGYAPSIAQTANQAVAPGVGALSITGFAPVVSQQSSSPSLTPGTAVLVLTGYAPTVQQGSSVQLLGGGPGGPRKRRKGGTESYLERLLGRPLEDEEPEQIEVIEQAAEIAAVAPQPPSKEDAAESLRAYGIALKDAYVQVYLELEQKKRQDREDEEIAAVIAAAL
jgi:hypothetical protein